MSIFVSSAHKCIVRLKNRWFIEFDEYLCVIRPQRYASKLLFCFRTRHHPVQSLLPVIPPPLKRIVITTRTHTQTAETKVSDSREHVVSTQTSPNSVEIWVVLINMLKSLFSGVIVYTCTYEYIVYVSVICFGSYPTIFSRIKQGTKRKSHAFRYFFVNIELIDRDRCEYGT